MAKRAEAEHRSLSDWARLVLLNAGSDGAYVESQPVVRTDPSRSAVRRLHRQFVRRHTAERYQEALEAMA